MLGGSYCTVNQLETSLSFTKITNDTWFSSWPPSTEVDLHILSHTGSVGAKSEALNGVFFPMQGVNCECNVDLHLYLAVEATDARVPSIFMKFHNLAAAVFKLFFIWSRVSLDSTLDKTEEAVVFTYYKNYEVEIDFACTLQIQDRSSSSLLGTLLGKILIIK